MPAQPQLATFTAGEETVVDVAHVQRHLAQLWAAATESDGAAGRGAITRACRFNLIAVCETDADRDQLTATIRALTSRHPCRALLLRARFDAADDELSAAITGHCHLAAGGGKQVCCEQITLQAAGGGIAQLPGAVRPLLESDLPTILWWTGDLLARRELFLALADGAQRVFFDSSAWPAARLGELAALIPTLPRCQFCDLSWTRLEGWRGLTADLFESAAAREQLAALDRVSVTHGRGPGAALRSWLFGAWLGAQLGWDAATTRARLRVACSDRDDAAGAGLLAVELRSPTARFCVDKNHGEQAATTVAHLPAACELPRKRAFWATDDAALIAQELDRPTRHAVYERALRLAAQLM